MEGIWRSPVEGKVGKIHKNPITPTDFIHRRWLALGFLNHQQYYFETMNIYEPKKKNVESQTGLFRNPWGRQIRCWKISCWEGFNCFYITLKHGDPELFVVFFESGSHDFIDFLGRLMFLRGPKKYRNPSLPTLHISWIWSWDDTPIWHRNHITLRNLDICRGGVPTRNPPFADEIRVIQYVFRGVVLLPKQRWQDLSFSR